MSLGCPRDPTLSRIFVSGGLAASPCALIMEMNTESIQAFKATSANTNLLICSSQVNCSRQPSQSNKRSQSNKSLQSNKRLAHDLSALMVTALILLFLFHLISCSCRTGLRVSDRHSETRLSGSPHGRGPKIHGILKQQKQKQMVNKW